MAGLQLTQEIGGWVFAQPVTAGTGVNGLTNFVKTVETSMDVFLLQQAIACLSLLAIVKTKL